MKYWVFHAEQLEKPLLAFFQRKLAETDAADMMEKSGIDPSWYVTQSSALIREFLESPEARAAGLRGDKEQGTNAAPPGDKAS